jgi:lipoprotein-anchoring transpeptidase ErfK/SrfK
LRGRGALTAALTAVLLVACGGPSGDARKPDATTSSRSTAPTTTTVPTTPSTLAPGNSYIATARVDQIPVFDAPGAPTPTQTFVNPWFVNGEASLPVPLVFAVEDSRPDGWLHVLLPIRPNGSTGWIRASDVDVTSSPFHILVSLSAHHLTVYNGTVVVIDDTVAVGAPATPTPTGHFYIRALLKAPNPNTTYGPYAYGLSGYSETLEQFAGGDAEVGIHGNNDASVLGQNVSHGCVRMSNDAIRKLTRILPLGTPVEIVA